MSRNSESQFTRQERTILSDRSNGQWLRHPFCAVKPAAGPNPRGSPPRRNARKTNTRAVRAATPKQPTTLARYHACGKNQNRSKNRVNYNRLCHSVTSQGSEPGRSTLRPPGLETAPKRHVNHAISHLFQFLAPPATTPHTPRHADADSVVARNLSPANIDPTQAPVIRNSL